MNDTGIRPEVIEEIRNLAQKYRDYSSVFADNFLILQTITNLINKNRFLIFDRYRGN